MGLFTSNRRKLNWENLEDENSLKEAISADGLKVFFKHSTRCSISSMALNQFESSWREENKCKLFFIDLIRNRSVSTLLSELSGIEHQSPQVLLMEGESVLYNASHGAISANEIKKITDDKNS